MTFMIQLDFSEPINLFHYTTRLPVGIVKNGMPEQTVPARIETAEKLVAGGAGFHVPYSPQERTSPQFVSSEYGERFIVTVIDDTFLAAAGPFLTEPMHGAALVAVIRSKKIPIRLKATLEAYYRSLPIVSPQTYYYCGKLMALLFGPRNIRGDAGPRPVGDEVHFIQEYFQNTYKNREKMFTHPPYFLEKRLIGQIKICDEDGAVSTLREINLLSRAVLAKDPLRSLKNSIICSCTFFTRAVIDAGVFPDTAFTYSDTFIQEIEAMDDISLVRDFEQEIVRQFISLVRENASANYSRPVFDAMQYINNNLTQELSLPEVARHAFVHPNYLSGLFKRETGRSITDFIARQRIAESEYFVKYTDYEIADIAGFYHFCSQSYYCTLFKKYLSVSPRACRKHAKSGPACPPAGTTLDGGTRVRPVSAVRKPPESFDTGDDK